MTEKNTEKGSIFTQAIRAVKGENTQQLVENFTAEMTLVAEGLFEDQAGLHRRMDDLLKDQDRQTQDIASQIAVLEQQMEENQREYDRNLTELRTRLATLEKKEEENEKETRKKKRGLKNEPSFMTRLLTVVVILCVTAVLVTLLAKLL